MVSSEESRSSTHSPGDCATLIQECFLLREKGIGLIALAIFGLLVASGPRAVFAQSDFTIAANPATRNVQAGMTGTSNITVTSSSVDVVNLAINNTSICSLSQSSLTVTPPASNSSTLSCRSLVLGTVAVNVTGTSGSFQHSILVTFLFKVLVNLDGNSLGQTDSVVNNSASQAKSFRVGAIVNASSTNSISNVFGWQFEIDYNATAFIPQGDPSAASLYPDGAANTALFGAQIGSTNWQGLINGGKAFGSFTNSVAGSTGQLQVFLAILAPNPPVTISAKTLLANVQFELLTKPSPAAQSFTITNVIFADQNSNPILSATSGAGANETITNSPPTASFTVTALLKDDPACIPVTGSNCSPYAFSFDGSTSGDPEDGAIASTNFFWDFGDGTQDLATTGPVVVHDYNSQGQFDVSLRVEDNLGATGSARDSLGGLILNSQLSHTSQRVVAANGFTITASPGALSITPSALGPVGTSIITLTSVTTGFGGNVVLTTMVVPGGTYAPATSFNTTTVLLRPGSSNSSRLTVSVSALTPHLTTNVTVIGTVGSVSNNVTITLVPTTMKVLPLEVTGVASGGSFTVNITGSAADLFGWQFQLNYNKTLLSTSLPGISLGSFWQNALTANQGFVVRQVNQTGGYVIVAFTLLSGATASNGNTTLVSMTFNVNSNGVTALRLSNSFLLNSTGRAILFTQGNGVFCNISCVAHDVAITSVSSQPTSVNIGDSVSVTVAVTNRGLNPENVTINLLVGTSTIGQKQVFLYPGDTATVNFQWDTGGQSSGPYSIVAQATTAGSTDGNPADNSLSGSVTLNPPGGPGSNSLFTYIIVAAVSVAAVSTAFLLLRRRKRLPPGPAH